MPGFVKAHTRHCGNPLGIMEAHTGQLEIPQGHHEPKPGTMKAYAGHRAHETLLSDRTTFKFLGGHTLVWSTLGLLHLRALLPLSSIAGNTVPVGVKSGFSMYAVLNLATLPGCCVKLESWPTSRGGGQRLQVDWAGSEWSIQRVLSQQRPLHLPLPADPRPGADGLTKSTQPGPVASGEATLPPYVSLFYIYR